MGAWGEIKIMLVNGKIGISVAVCTVVGHGGRMRFHYSAERSGKKGGREREEGRRTRTAVAMKVSYLSRKPASPFVSCKMPVRCVRAEREFMGLSGRDARGSAQKRAMSQGDASLGHDR